MKKSLLLTFSLFSMTTFGQSNLTYENVDMNGAPFKTGPKTQTEAATDMSFSSATADSYTAARKLTEINDITTADAYPWISPDGMRLYYTHGSSVRSLMFTKRANDTSNFEAPIVIPTTVSNAASHWLTPDELNLYITSGGALYYTSRASLTDPFNTAVAINLGTTYQFIAGVSLNEAQNQLFLYNGSAIHQFERSSPTSFTFVSALPFPSGYSPGPGHLSKDGLTYFVSATVATGERLLHQFSRAALTEAFSDTTFSLIQGINDMAVSNSQPSMSTNLDHVVFVRNTNNTWDDNELYIAKKQGPTSIIDEELRINSSLFPNPSTGNFTIKLKDSNYANYSIEIYNTLGETILNTNKLDIDLSGSSKGIYFVKISNGSGTKIQKILIQ